MCTAVFVNKLMTLLEDSAEGLLTAGRLREPMQQFQDKREGVVSPIRNSLSEFIDNM